MIVSKLTGFSFNWQAYLLLSKMRFPVAPLRARIPAWCIVVADAMEGRGNVEVVGGSVQGGGVLFAESA